MSLTLPLYQSHKQVRAAEIIDVDPTTRRIRVAVPVNEEGDEKIGSQTIMVDAGWLERFDPKPGMYLVEYADGYRSVSPATAFVDGYTAISEDDADDSWTGDGRHAPAADPAGAPLAQPAPEQPAKSSGLSHDDGGQGF